jgi:6-phosphogluconolactonase
LNRNRVRIIVEKNEEALSDRGARLFEQKAIEAAKREGRFFVALSGGTTPRRMHAKFADRPSIPWREVHIFWADERCVPVENPSSNVGAAWEDFLGKVPLPEEQIHAMPVHMPPEEGALSYEREIKRLLGLKQVGLPSFDLVFLGLGRDGHTASLFPAQAPLEEGERWVVAVKGGDPEVNRLTLTLPTINQAKEVVFLVSGKAKAEVVKAVIEDDVEGFPASRVRPAILTWLLDRDAASLLPERVLNRG